MLLRIFSLGLFGSFHFLSFLPEYEKNGSFVLLQEVDASSEVIGEVTMLNTLKHYKVRGRRVCDQRGVTGTRAEWQSILPPNDTWDEDVASQTTGCSYI